MAHTEAIMAQEGIGQTVTTNIVRNAIMNSAIVGACVGLFGWLFSLLVQNFFIANLFCRSADDFGVCANGGTVSWGIAFVIIGIISVFALVRANVYRPLLIVLAAFVALWGIAPWLAPLAWYWVGLWNALLFALAYAVFAWVASIDRFLYSTLLALVIIVLARLALLQ